MFTMLSLLAAVTLAPQGALADASVPVALEAAQRDPGDSLYRAGRQLLNRNRYVDAARSFRDLIRRYPRSASAPDAYYWQAFALYRTGDDGNLRRATTLLEYQQAHFASASTRGDGDALLARVYGELARRGDSHAGEWVQAHANAVAPARAAAGAVPAVPAAPAEPAEPATATDERSGQRPGCAREDDDPRVAALNALMQMDAASAVPVLRRVLERRDACSIELRRRAIFVLSQKRTPETEDVLLSVARGDPDGDVRQQAVFWLSQVGSDRAVAALDSIARNASDEELRDKALFSLSQIHGDRALQALRDYASREDAPEESRTRAVFWLGQRHDPQSAVFLRDLYGRTGNPELKERILFSLSQMRSPETTRWLLDQAVDQGQGVELRKKAIFWASQSGADIGDLVRLYDRTTDHDIREQLIFVYSQRRDAAAMDKMIDIARHEMDRELRNKAVFWLGQSHDPRAAQALLEIINQ